MFIYILLFGLLLLIGHGINKLDNKITNIVQNISVAEFDNSKARAIYQIKNTLNDTRLLVVMIYFSLAFPLAKTCINKIKGL